MYSDTIDVLWLHFTNDTGAADHDTRRPNEEEIAAFKIYAGATEAVDSKSIDEWVKSYFVDNNSKDLFEFISHDLATHESGYCVSRYSDGAGDKIYIDWEKEVATPELEKLGFKVIGWFMGEADSFGPLTRYAKVEKDGVKFDLVYG